MQGGVGLLADMGGEFGGVELAPAAPTGLGGQRVRLGGGEVAVNRAEAQRETLGGLGTRAPVLDKLHHALTQIQRVGFHAHTLPAILPM
jgi:hypothetical protein